jgi:hypothetical protein
MTACRRETVRHVPEDELHAYMDQALSRSQCIEIETHLAHCPLCQHTRDALAALRDRTTALLAKAAPRRVEVPPFPGLVALAEQRRRRSWRRSALWAASFGGAVLAGWGLRTVLDPHGNLVPAPTQTAAATLLPSGSPAGMATVAVEETEPLPRLTRSVSTVPESPRILLAAERSPLEPSPPDPVGASVDPDPDMPADLALEAGWRITTLDEAEEATGGMVPAAGDYPVTGVRLRPAGPEERPLIIVSQLHPSGTMIHTLEGPVSDVAQVVATQLSPALRFNSSDPSRSPPDYLERAGAIRRTSRVLAVIGRLAVDSLNALAQAVTIR